jgi:hypothetical protein
MCHVEDFREEEYTKNNALLERLVSPTSGNVIRSTELQTVMGTSGTTRDILAAYYSLLGILGYYTCAVL